MDNSDKINFYIKLSNSEKELLKRGLRLIGPGTGAYLGLLTNDPTSIVLSAAIGDALSQSINDFADRSLSEKENFKWPIFRGSLQPDDCQLTQEKKMNRQTS